MDNNWILSEFSSIELPDKRYESNFQEILNHLNAGLGLSYSRALGERLRKSAWRLFSRAEMDLQTTHREQTLERCVNESIILATEDTTDLNYTHHKSKDWAGRLGGADKCKAFGINVHSSLLLSAVGVPLGLAYQHIFIPNDNHKGLRHRNIPLEEKESYKWILALRQLNALWENKAAQTIIKIADRESDFYELYEHPRNTGIELLQRVKHKNRNILFNDKACHLIDALKQLDVLATGEVKIQRTKENKERTAIVNYYATTIKVPPSGNVQKGETVEMNLIWVKEPSDDKDALEWILLTTLPIKTIENVLQAVKYYTFRWVIERFHYIIKQSMAIEKVQIDDFTRLFNVIQIYSVIAWHLLFLHRLGKLEDKHPANQYFEQQSIEILEIISNKKIETVNDFILALAQLAGFVPTKQQPNPGEKTLTQAMIRFLSLFRGFMAAKKFYATG
jgi:hypothetical protein